MRAADNTRGIDMNCLKERSIQVQRLAETLKEKHDDMKEWYNIRNTKITDGVKRITDGFEVVRKRVNILWGDRCKQQELLKKRDHDSDDPGNPDTYATSKQPPATASTQIVVVEPTQIESTQGTAGGTAIHPITGKVLEEGEIVADLSHEQLLAFNEMKEIDDAAIEDILSEPKETNLENVEEIVFEGDNVKSTYMREDGTEFTPFNEEWLKENMDVIDEQLKIFLSKVSKPIPAEVLVDYQKYEKENLHGKIICWMFNKEIHCIAIKHEYGIQYFRSLLSILSLPFYEVQRCLLAR
ncbi:hypothetical protein Hanom_Chr03g00218031 [Helianthus anomalus]